jgi:hypothetical protein
MHDGDNDFTAAEIQRNQSASWVQDFCSNVTQSTLSHQVKVGGYLLQELSHDPLSSDADEDEDTSIIADTCIRYLLNDETSESESGSESQGEESIVFLKLLGILLPLKKVRQNIRHPDALLPALLLSTHRQDPTNFIIEVFDIIFNLICLCDIEVSYIFLQTIILIY